MARALSVKVPTALVISQIENKIAEIKAKVATYPADVKQYESDKAKYHNSLIEIAKNALANSPELVGEHYNSPICISVNYAGNVVATFDSAALGFPEPPVRPEEPNAYHYVRGGGRTTQLETLEKTLKVLKMTEQTEVNASTYSSVMDLL